MSDLRFSCCDELRRNAIAGHATLNAIDYLEVGDLAPGQLAPAEQAEYAALPPGVRDQLLWQRRLTVHFVNPLTAAQAAAIDGETVRIDGGERIRGIRVRVLPPNPAGGSTNVVLATSVAGDFSRYVMRLARSATDPRPPEDFDPILSEVAFSFKVDCPSEFDCRRGHVCLRTPPDEPEIDYLAKDYGSFRRLLLDRLSLLLPDWRERNAADFGVALVELLAYAGDHLSYEQDARATEAYLDTARLRTSIRRHALLVDYAMHDGRNARAWLQVRVSADATIDPRQFRCCTAVPGLPPRIGPATPDETVANAAAAEWFEPVVAEMDPTVVPNSIPLFADLNDLFFYTWGDDRCCLQAGATAATLRGQHAQLAAGMVLVLEEILGPETGDAADADRDHRHVVRLTEVVATDGGQPLVDPLDNTPITNIRWHDEDALPFPLCVSARAGDGSALTDASVARGNVVLVDHGRTRTDQLGAVPPPTLEFPDSAAEDDCGPDDRCDVSRDPVPVRFAPVLPEGPLTSVPTVRVGIDTAAGPQTVRKRVDESAAAAAATGGAARDFRPAVFLTSQSGSASARWDPVRDLLDAGPDATAFVVESEHDGTATVRFGDGRQGRAPRTDEAFVATYRVGNGRRGNVGADAIAHVVSADGRIDRVRNPLPATAGLDPESAEETRRRAPEAFRTQERAVTPADYEAVTVRAPSLQRAAATLRWTGSWHTVFLTVDRTDGRLLDDALERGLTEHVDRYRMAGHDLEFDDPRFVSLEIELEVCVDPEYFREDVKQRLLEVFSNGILADGQLGLFHPDRFTFGQTIYLSPILAAARSVAGVRSADVVTFQRQGTPDTVAREDGRLLLGRLEIARLDNDPDFPERGVLRLMMLGGR
jgi:hypothetical protein